MNFYSSTNLTLFIPFPLSLGASFLMTRESFLRNFFKHHKICHLQVIISLPSFSHLATFFGVSKPTLPVVRATQNISVVPYIDFMCALGRALVRTSADGKSSTQPPTIIAFKKSISRILASASVFFDNQVATYGYRMIEAG
jgi:hypothetical protein